ncbi:hypothetical protein NNO07_17455 [Pseudomonas resinovorans]|uniref:Uncharacterized protein n=1 Tax=Metapseudomonas resinovorans TaxID=53412 RepID=A0ABT4Y7T9_METRE|nr:hypothetical protein [Pseudomonas resinovorans]MDA8484858.1 hypothetical protein [Pseudomonas resinovorans]
MRYQLIPGQPNTIIWFDDSGCSGVIRPTDVEMWAEFEAWQAAGNAPEPGGTPDERSLEELRIAALSAVNAEVDAALLPITGRYSRAEIDTWPAQRSEARAWLADNQTPTPLLDTIAGDLDAVGKQAFCEAVLIKADAHKGVAGTAIAWRRTMTQWIYAQVGRESLLSFRPIYPNLPT